MLQLFITPPDYFLFPELKMKLKGLHFAYVAKIQEAVTDELKKVQKEAFSEAFQKLYDRAKRCIYARTLYQYKTLSANIRNAHLYWSP
jgi:hypothetical protein